MARKSTKDSDREIEAREQVRLELRLEIPAVRTALESVRRAATEMWERGRRIRRSPRAEGRSALHTR